MHFFSGIHSLHYNQISFNFLIFFLFLFFNYKIFIRLRLIFFFTVLQHKKQFSQQIPKAWIATCSNNTSTIINLFLFAKKSIRLNTLPLHAQYFTSIRATEFASLQIASILSFQAEKNYSFFFVGWNVERGAGAQLPIHSF